MRRALLVSSLCLAVIGTSACDYPYPQPASSDAASDASSEIDAVTPRCGDGHIDQGEDCDGDSLGGATCASQGRTMGMLACMACHFDFSGCYACGNNSIEGPEACDGANLDMQTCASRGFHGGTLGCKADCLSFDISHCGTCGDGIREAAEACDGVDFGQATCASLGFAGGGSLRCTACVITTEDCIQ